MRRWHPAPAPGGCRRRERPIHPAGCRPRRAPRGRRRCERRRAWPPGAHLAIRWRAASEWNARWACSKTQSSAPARVMADEGNTSARCLCRNSARPESWRDRDPAARRSRSPKRWRSSRPSASPPERCRASPIRHTHLLLFLRCGPRIVKITCSGCKKQRGDFHGRLHRAARIIAQIDTRPLRFAPPSFSMVFHQLTGGLVETRDPQIADSGRDHETAVDARRVDQLRRESAAGTTRAFPGLRTSSTAAFWRASDRSCMSCSRSDATQGYC